ncbi:MAG: PAS domain S-box protein, partial [Longimicrobiales bacterium]
MYASRVWERFALAGGAAVTEVGVGVNYLAVVRRAASEHDLDARRALAGVDAVLSGELPSFEMDYSCHAPFEERWFLMRAEPMPAKHGGAVISHVDVTELRRAEQALQQSHERLGIAITAGGIGTWDLDFETREFVIDRSLKRIMRIPEDQPLTYDEWIGMIHPDDTELANREVQKCLDGAVPAFEVAKRMVTRDGTERWFSCRGTVIRGPGGRPLRLVGTDADITEQKAVETALAEQTLKYRGIFEAASVGIWELDYSGVKATLDELPPEARCDVRGYLNENPGIVRRALGSVTTLDINPTAMRLAGAPSKSALLHYPPVRLLPDAERVLLEQMVAIADGVRTTEFEAALRTFQGGRRDIVFTTRYPDDGGFGTVLLCAHDVTERKRALEALRASEERYRSVVETQTEMICRFREDTTLTFANPAFCRTFSKRWEDLIGARYVDFLPAPSRRVLFGHMQRLRDGANETVMEHETLLPDGRSAWHRWVHQRIGGTADTIGYQAVGSDITLEKRAELELRRSHERYAMATAAGLVSVYDHDLTTNEVHSDPLLQTNLGYDPADVRTREHWLELMPPEDRERVLDNERRMLDMDALCDGDDHTALPEISYRVFSRDGSPRWFLNRGTLLREPDGTPVRVVGTITDITAQKQTEGALERSNAQIRSLAGRLIAAQEKERKRIARELHDDLSQRLAGVAIDISNARRQVREALPSLEPSLERLQSQIGLLVESIRNLSHEMHPGVLEHAGLVTALN